MTELQSDRPPSAAERWRSGERPIAQHFGAKVHHYPRYSNSRKPTMYSACGKLVWFVREAMAPPRLCAECSRRIEPYHLNALTGNDEKAENDSP